MAPHLESFQARSFRFACDIVRLYVLLSSRAGVPAHLVRQMLRAGTSVGANLEEARALTGQHDPVDCARAIHRAATNVALTLSADGSLLVHKDELYPVEGVRVDAIDTTGAGDMYAAGVLYGLTHGLTWQQAGRLGSHAAARIVAQMGARLERKLTPDEIRALLG